MFQMVGHGMGYEIITPGGIFLSFVIDSYKGMRNKGMHLNRSKTRDG